MSEWEREQHFPDHDFGPSYLWSKRLPRRGFFEIFVPLAVEDEIRADERRRLGVPPSTKPPLIQEEEKHGTG